MKDLTWMLIGIATIVSAAALTATGDLPGEVFAGLAATAITAIFKDRETDKVRASWEAWAAKEAEK